MRPPERSPTFTADGRQVVFARRESPTVTTMNSYLHVINVDGTGLRRLTTRSITETSPAVSPDGTRIAYQSTPG